MKQALILMSLGAFGVGCTGVESNLERIDVNAANSLGVVAIEIDQSAPGDAESFLRVNGLDASGNTVASFEQRVGTIPGINDRLPGIDELGSERIIMVQGQTWHGMSREMHATTVPPLSESAGYKDFFNLAAVKSALGNQHVTVDVPQRGGDASGAEVAMTSGSCNAGSIMTSPVVAQCCEDSYGLTPNYHTFFKPTTGANANQLIVRYSAGYGSCKGYWGGSCSGTNCYFGPGGWSKPDVYTNSSSYVVITQWVGYWDDQAYQYQFDQVCTSSSSGSTEFGGTMSGSIATGQGCPGGASGYGEWDY